MAAALSARAFGARQVVSSADAGELARSAPLSRPGFAPRPYDFAFRAFAARGAPEVGFALRDLRPEVP